MYRDERDELSEAITRVHNDSETMKAYLSQVEARHAAAERVVMALRDALRDERGARNRAEAQSGAYAKASIPLSFSLIVSGVTQSQ